jgi:hypothetical protein
VGLTNMSDPIHLDLIVIQVQGNVSLINIPDPRHLDLVVGQVYGT